MTGAPLPINLLCGYLGSGKTTQLNFLLKHTSQRVAVMVNDFGAVQIDANLISGATGDVIRLTNGCICCAMNGDLFRGFDRIFSVRDQIDRLVIEGSGVAEPNRLTTIARAERDFDCQRVVTTVCAKSFMNRLCDPAIWRVLEAQILEADAFIFNRCDVATPTEISQVRSVVAALNIEAATFEKLNDDALSGPHHPLLNTGQPRAHFEQFNSAVVPLLGQCDRDSFTRFFRSAPKALHRAKGFVNFWDDARTNVFQFAAGELSCQPYSRKEVGVAVLIGPALQPEHFHNMPVACKLRSS